MSSEVREGMEYMNVRDLRVLARIVGRGRIQANQLVELASTGGLYVSLNRLAALGYIKKIDRGVYEATEKGRKAIIDLIMALEAELYVNVKPKVTEAKG